MVKSSPSLRPSVLPLTNSPASVSQSAPAPATSVTAPQSLASATVSLTSPFNEILDPLRDRDDVDPLPECEWFPWPLTPPMPRQRARPVPPNSTKRRPRIRPRTARQPNNILPNRRLVSRLIHIRPSSVSDTSCCPTYQTPRLNHPECLRVPTLCTCPRARLDSQGA